jgi:hypothetical protein
MRSWILLGVAGTLAACVPPNRPDVSPAAHVAAPASTSVKRITYDDPGVFTLPDGTAVLADTDGGFTLPNGARVVPDGAGGLTLPNGTRCEPDGRRSYICP